MPPQPTTHGTQWYHGTLNRAESERIFKHAKSILENEVKTIRKKKTKTNIENTIIFFTFLHKGCIRNISNTTFGA